MTDSGSPGSRALRLEILPPLAWLILDQADRGNPVNQQFAAEIVDAWAFLAEHHDVRAVGVRATGPSFSVGILSEGDRPQLSIGPKACGNWRPVLVELAGDIAAGAFELLGQADAIVSAPDIHLTIPDDPKSRLDVQHLRPRIPEPELRRLALLGAFGPMTAVRAAQLGLIDAVVPRQGLHRHAVDILNLMASRG